MAVKLQQQELEADWSPLVHSQEAETNDYSLHMLQGSGPEKLTVTPTVGGTVTSINVIRQPPQLSSDTCVLGESIFIKLTTEISH